MSPGQTRFSTTKKIQARRSPRSGQALLEFAIISFVFLFLVAAVLSFGLLLFSANTLQQAADVGAQELARHPYAPNGTFEDGLADSGLFEEQYLVCEIRDDGDLTEEDLPAEYTQVQYLALQDRMPLINRLLLPLYIFDPDLNALRYPGTVVTRGGELTVVIPIIDTTDASTANQQITQWRQVVEEVTDASGAGPYALDSGSTTIDSGMVALRINYPYQAAGLVAYEYRQGNAAGPVVEPRNALGEDDIFNVPVAADDTAVSDSTNFLSDNGYTLVNTAQDPDYDAFAHRGRYGLGTQVAHTTLVRPYRKVVSAQAIYRRELFE